MLLVFVPRRAWPPFASGGRFPWVSSCIVAIVTGLTLSAGSARADSEEPVASPAATPRLPNVLLISIDDLRPDRLGVYGSGRPTSPAVDRLAAEAVVFENVYSTSSWTLPAHASMMTGLHPKSHHAVLRYARTAPDAPMLAEIFQKRGYATRAVTSGGWVTPPFGFGRGFDGFEVVWAPGLGVRRVIEVLGEIGPEQPYFFFFHTFGVHCPFHVPPPYRAPFDTRPAEDHLDLRGKCDAELDAMELDPGQLAFIRDRYDAGIRRTDDKLATLFDFLRERGDLDRTIVILTSDHGEEFREHGRMGHGRALYAETLRIPLLIRVPGGVARRVRTPTSLVDLAPTVLDLAGIGGPDMEGQSLVPRLREGDGADEPRPLYAETSMYEERLRSVVFEGRQLIVDRESGERLVYDLERDPAQSDPLPSDEVPKGLSSLLKDHFGAGAPAPVATVMPSKERIEQLRALGYVE